VGESQAIVERLFTRAAEKVGSVSRLARELNVPYSEVRSYVHGEAMPPEEILLRAVDFIIEELPAIRAGFSREAWQSLGLPVQAS
jgi:hypothetical protein